MLSINTIKKSIIFYTISLATFPLYCYSAENSGCSDMYSDNHMAAVDWVKSTVEGHFVHKQKAIQLLRDIPKDGEQSKYFNQVYSNLKGVELNRNGDWVCVGVPGKRPIEVLTGWVPKDVWLLSPQPQQESYKWEGVWQNDSAKIKIAKTGDNTFKFIGNAIWVGKFSDMPHFADFSFTASPERDFLHIPKTKENNCELNFKYLGDYLFVSSPEGSMCGAVNTTFNGVYRFRKNIKTNY
ncbi:hypothetical protein [Tolumonas lignilytica]|uniref:hypothetical protein n=1 Tax=Tolumonas lignilytica TaxID=1283284 RepID=UPI00046467CE|nr:hypothetical protein [Tolumonas lignilytica]